MELKKLEPWSFLNDFHNEIDRIFSRHVPGGSAGLPVSAWATEANCPAVDIADNDKNYLVTANVAGYEPKEITISYDNGNLTICGERALEREEKGQNFIRKERESGAFSRSFSLPNVAEDKEIKANYKNGVLTITLPKIKTTATRQIKINS